jgi:hypothetical protein
MITDLDYMDSEITKIKDNFDNFQQAIKFQDQI